MRAILNLANPDKPVVKRVCGSIQSSIRTFAMLQIERDKKRSTKKPCVLAIVEMNGSRHVGQIVPTNEFTIIHSEKVNAH